MQRLSRWIGLVVLVVAAGPVKAQDAPPAAPAPSAAEIGRALDEFVLREHLGQFWGAVLVARNGEPLLMKGYGLANDRLEPITSGTLFDIASVSKMFTAAAVLRLEIDGKLATTDTVSKFYPGLGELSEKVTLQHLLTHTSGLTDQRALQWLGFDKRDEAVKLAMESVPTGEPGAEFEYCNAGYVVLAAVIEKVTGGPYERYVREHIFKPAGMTHSGYLDGEGLDASKQAWRVVSQYGEGRAPAKALLDKDLEPWGWGLKGAGGVVTTIEDLLKWDRALAGESVLSAPAKEKMFTPDKQGYACGWSIRKTSAGTPRQEHGGGTRGFAANVARLPEEGVVVAVLSNDRFDPEDLSQRLLNIALPETSERLAVSLYLDGYEANEAGVVELPDRCRWFVMSRYEGMDPSMRAMHEERPVVALVDTQTGAWVAMARMDRPVAGRLATMLDGMLSETEGRQEGGDPDEMDVVLGTRPYERGERGRFDMPDSAKWVAMPAYRGTVADGTPVDDNRITLVLVDEGNSFWPLIAKMGRGTATKLVEDLRRVGAE